MLKMQIIRFEENEKQTLGMLQIFDTKENYIKYFFECYALELPDKNNKKKESRIPSGVYQVKKRWSWKFKNHLHIKNVPDRTWILIHSLNFYYQTQGCVGVGDRLKDINNDGKKDILNSKKTLKKILDIMPKKFELTILNNFGG